MGREILTRNPSFNPCKNKVLQCNMKIKKTRLFQSSILGDVGKQFIKSTLKVILLKKIIYQIDFKLFKYVVKYLYFI